MMTKRLISSLLIFIPGIVITACSTDDEATSPTTLVVESYLYVGHPFKVVVSDLVGAEATDVDALSVSISHGNEILYLNAAGDGTYVSDSSVLVTDIDGDYTLKFVNDGTEISSLAVVPSKPADFTLSTTELTIEPRGSGPPFGGNTGNINDNSVELKWSNPDNGYYFTYFENIEDDPELINTGTNGNRPNIFFRGAPTQESSSTIRPNQFEYYGRYNVILFHVNADYAALYNEQDNSSSLNLQPPFTNVVNGMGIFTAIHSDTVVLTINKP